MTGDRAVSDVVGFVVIFSLVVTTVAVVSVYGLGALQDARNEEQVNNADRAFDVLADNMADIHQEGAPSRATEIKLQQARLQTGSPVAINVTGISASGPPHPNVTYQLTPIEYVGPDDRIVYEAGAIFRDQGEGGIVVKEPPMQLAGDRLLLPIVQTEPLGNVSSVAEQTVRVRAERGVREPLPQFRQPETTYEAIVLTIESQRYELWQRYIERTTDADCRVPSGRIAVRCTFDDPEGVYATRVRINYAIET